MTFDIDAALEPIVAALEHASDRRAQPVREWIHSGSMTENLGDLTLALQGIASDAALPAGLRATAHEVAGQLAETMRQPPPPAAPLPPARAPTVVEHRRRRR